MTRRELIALLASTAASSCPRSARAQSSERVRRVGVLMNMVSDDPAGQERLIAFVQGLQQLGWTDGRNVRIDVRRGRGDAQYIRKAAGELVADVILGVGTPATGPLLQATRTIPIVFVQVADPVGAAFVERLAHPGGNATGFSNFEYGTTAKWLELLKDIAPKLSRVGVLRDATVPSGIGQWGAIQTAAASLNIELSPINLTRPEEIDRGVSAFASEPNSGLIVTAGGATAINRELIIGLAARHHLPAIYSDRIFVLAGGLFGYGPDRLDQYRRAPSYITHPQRRETSRPSRASADQVRAGD